MIPVENSIIGRQGRRAPPAAELGPEDHRRALQADPLPADGQPGTRLEDVRTVISACRSPPPSAARSCAGWACAIEAAGDTAGSAQAPGRAPRSRHAPPSRRRSPPSSTAWRSSPATSRTRPTTPPASSCMTADPSPPRPPAGVAMRHQLHLPGPQPAGGALQGAGRLRHQRRQHDQARELHGERRLHGDLLLRRGRRPARGPRRCRAPSRSWASSPTTSRCWASIRPIRSASAADAVHAERP